MNRGSGAAPPSSGVQGAEPLAGVELIKGLFYFQRSCCVRNSSENVISESQRTNLQFRKPFENQLFSVNIPNGCTVSSAAAPVRLLQNLINSSGSFSWIHMNFLHTLNFIRSNNFGRTTEIDLIWKCLSRLSDIRFSVVYIKSP